MSNNGAKKLRQVMPPVSAALAEVLGVEEELTPAELEAIFWERFGEGDPAPAIITRVITEPASPPRPGP